MVNNFFNGCKGNATYKLYNKNKVSYIFEGNQECKRVDDN